MTFPKNWNSFSPVFRELITQGSLRKIEVPNDSEKQARSLAASIRAFIGQVYAATKREQQAGVRESLLQELSMFAQATMIRVEGTVVQVMPRALDPRYERVKVALESSGASAPAAPSNEINVSLARLQSLMAPEPGFEQAPKGEPGIDFPLDPLEIEKLKLSRGVEETAKGYLGR